MIVNLLRVKWNYIVTFFLVAFTNIYITSITSLSPAYIGIVLAPISLILFCNKESIKKRQQTNELVVLVFSFLVYLLISCAITGNFNDVFFYINYFFYNHFVFIIALFYLQHCNLYQLKRIIKLLFIFSTIIFFIDFIWRVTHSINQFKGLLAFYNFKFNSLMFLDSNWPGFMSMLVFSLLVYLADNKLITNKKYLWISFVSVLLTLSRAAIVCCIIVILFSKFIKLSKKLRIYISFVGIPIVFAGMIYILTNLLDSSFLSKLELLKGMYYYLTHFGINNLLFGNYPDANHDNVIFMNTWIGGHLYMTRYIDFGFMACFFEFFFLLVIMIFTKFKSLYLVIPFFIAGLSFCPWNVPYFYIELAIIYVIENKLYTEKLSPSNISINFKRTIYYIFKYN